MFFFERRFFSALRGETTFYGFGNCFGRLFVVTLQRIALLQFFRRDLGEY